MTQQSQTSVLVLAIAALAACGKQPESTHAPSGTTSSRVRCQGINSCRGKGECNAPGHTCGKHTPCKGQGWLTVDDADTCHARGGTVL